ncbi:MAG: bifunctional phosphopantothenoylcysteine decarboxylase/phosphopantothenate--cysteine ligase CoaBC [Bernardetiaceae bacterium]|nr:bifunctional phosphopantothenoylcysteine decarboxylase/phosphopantothenate--cysteine ligase CoaBC [Bernardetiaceae bacterium]
MNALQDKKIILGVTGSIAAYKAALLVRLLVKAGAQVQVLMTPAATEFIAPLTLATLAQRPVLSQLVSDPATGTWTNHVDLGLWADALVIAPASANTLAKMAHGQCDNLLLATYLSARCPVWAAPAMDLDMLAHPATQANLGTLAAHGVRLIEPGTGALASGLEGKGRLAEPEEILAELTAFFTTLAAPLPLLGKRALLTAGPTVEAIDPVRFISNHSSGKMGYALAEALAARGAEVTLVSGPVRLAPAHSRITRVPVESAAQMFEAVMAHLPTADLVVQAAAVADYTPRQVAAQKIKKKGDEGLTLELVKTADIAAATGQRLRPGQLHVGFALETEHELANAQSKLQRKNFDLIVLNSLQEPGAGFGHDTNKVTIIRRDGSVQPWPLLTKQQVAEKIVDLMVELTQP